MGGNKRRGGGGVVAAVAVSEGGWMDGWMYGIMGGKGVAAAAAAAVCACTPLRFIPPVSKHRPFPTSAMQPSEPGSPLYCATK